MTGERKPVAFCDMRGWIDALRAEGELKEINALVDWNIELGTIVRVAQGAGTGPALLFNNIKDIDLCESPPPLWNRADGGRYIGTYAGCVTKNPDTNVMNVGVYRGMIGDKDHIPIYMYRAQHIGHHALAWQQKGAKEMPIAYVIGWEPVLDFCSGSPIPMGVCEY